MINRLTSVRLDLPAKYQIKILGRLGQEWSASFGNLDLRVDYSDMESPITTLTGEVADQAALHGLLKEIRDLGMVLLSLECLGKNETA